MAKKPFYTSNELIEAVKRKMSIPITQVTFSEDDILEFANEEMFLAQVPSMMQYHEEYLVYRQRVKLIPNIRKYDIPERAIGMKLRDLFYVDDSNQLYEMANIGAGNQDFYQNNSFINNSPRHFFLENNSVILATDSLPTITGSLEMTYFLRPNSLVKDERAAVSNGFIKQVTVNTVQSGDVLKIDNTNLVAGTDFIIGGNPNITATNISSTINALQLDGINATVAQNFVSVISENRNVKVTSSNTTNLSVSTRTGIKCNAVPTHFVDRMYIDFLQTNGGHKTYLYDVRIPVGGVSSDAIFFEDNQIPNEFKLGDYLCQQNECIIPQVPSDLHTLLAERTCARILESLGDQAGLQASMSKIADLEERQSTLMSNRVDGAPKKIISRNSLLRFGKNRRGRRF
jgi:hypothetical protein